MTLSILERDHLRGALGRMYRGANGQVQINPNPNVRGFAGQRKGAGIGIRRNANTKVVAGLIAKGFLHEDENGLFHVTDAGRQALPN